MNQEVLDDLDKAFADWTSGEYPQYVPCVVNGKDKINLILTSIPDTSGFCTAFSFFCSVERAMNSPTLAPVPCVKFALLKDEVTAYHFWKRGLTTYTQHPSYRSHGMFLTMNPRIFREKVEPTLCVHCYLKHIRERYTCEGCIDELDSLEPFTKDFNLNDGIVFDAGALLSLYSKNTP